MSAAWAGQAGDETGGGPARRRFPRPGKWDWRLIALGFLALLSMSPIGHVGAVLAMISGIGLPLYLLLAALPSLFLICLFARLVWGSVAGFRRGAMGRAIVFAAAALFMLDFFVLRAHRENTRLDARAAALVADDIEARPSILPGGVLANVRTQTFRTRGESDVCDDLCQRLLLTGFARRVVVVTLVPPAPSGGRRARAAQADAPSLEPSADMSGTMYWLERRAECPDVEVPSNVRLLDDEAPRPRGGPRPIPSRSAAQAMRLRIAGGECLISAPATLDAADHAIFHGHVARGRGAMTRGFDASLDTIGAWRIASYRRDGAEWIAQHRATGVRYERFPGALIPTYRHGAELRITNGFLSFAAYRGPRERYVDDPPLARTLSALGVKLGIGTAPPEEAPRVIDEALASGLPLSALQAAIANDYLRRISQDGIGWLDPDEVRRIAAILADSRFPFGSAAQRAFEIIVAQQPRLAPDLTRDLFARLDAIVGSQAMVTEQERSSIASVSNALARLPDAGLRPYFDQFQALAGAPGLREQARNLLARLDVFGAFAIPTMFRLIDDGLAERAPRAPSSWNAIYGAGLKALCGLGKEAAFARPLLEERIERGGPQVIAAHERLLIATLSRMGASEDEIRVALSLDEKREGRLRAGLRAAAGARACG
jgi:hypothetical protein